MFAGNRRGALKGTRVGQYEAMTATDPDLSAADVAWDLEPLLDGAPSPLELMAQAKELAQGLAAYRGRVGALEAAELAELMTTLARINELIGRAGNYGMLRFSENTLDPERGALMQQVQEQATEVGTLLVFVELEFAAADDEHAARVLADPVLSFCRHHLELTRLNRPHLLTEPEEKVLIETSVTGASAWVRLPCWSCPTTTGWGAPTGTAASLRSSSRASCRATRSSCMAIATSIRRPLRAAFGSG